MGSREVGPAGVKTFSAGAKMALEDVGSGFEECYPNKISTKTEGDDV